MVWLRSSMSMRKRILERVGGVSDPRERKIIGRVFVEVFEKVAESIDGVEFLAEVRSIQMSLRA